MNGTAIKSTIIITGMHCSGCETLLTDVLSDTPGVQSAKVSLKAGSAVIEHDASVTEAQLRKAIEDEGYKTS